jgi:hypothetical protein
MLIFSTSMHNVVSFTAVITLASFTSSWWISFGFSAHFHHIFLFIFCTNLFLQFYIWRTLSYVTSCSLNSLLSPFLFIEDWFWLEISPMRRITFH